MKKTFKMAILGILGSCICISILILMVPTPTVEPDNVSVDKGLDVVDTAKSEVIVPLPVLSAADEFEVTVISLVEMEGFTITSAVCEVVSSERTPLLSGGYYKIVFHSFRVSSFTLDSEIVLLFGSNRTAADGSGLVYLINSKAVELFSPFPDGSTMNPPITIDTDGAQIALSCARQAGERPSLDFGGFDYEEWRLIAIERMGEEETYEDGSKTDYVQWAVSICNQSNTARETMLANLGAKYEGSWSQFVIESFCPYFNQ